MAFSSEIFKFQPHVAVKLVPVRLTLDNYPLWKSEMVPHLMRYEALNMVEATESDDKRNIKPSINDQECMDFIKLTLSEAMLPHTAGCSTPRALWLKLEETVRSHVTALLRELKKESDIDMKTYYESAKLIADQMVCPVSDGEFFKIVLKGLPDEYVDFCNSILVRSDRVTPEKLHGLLLEEEVKRLRKKNAEDEQAKKEFNYKLIIATSCLVVGYLYGKK